MSQNRREIFHKLHAASLSGSQIRRRGPGPRPELSRRAREWLRSNWNGQVFMAVGMKDPVLGPPVVGQLRNDIRDFPEAYEHAEAGHFVPEWGEDIATRALAAFK